MSQVARQLTPELLDLMEHEKVIEQGLTTFVEVGRALLAIRDGRKYRAAGFDTFEAYCRQRWELSRRRAYQLVDAAEIAQAVCTVVHTPLPSSERQVRPLAPLKDDPAAVAEAWATAVEESDGQVPTAAKVTEVVARRSPPKKEHPARFSDDLLDTIAPRVAGAGVVLDPFAGTGRVHELRERAGVTETIGIEIEKEWADMHEGTRLGNALDLDLDDESVDAVVTSPTYGNRMADHHDATDDSTRLTYKHTLGRDLDPDNSGQLQWGDAYREFHRRAWAEATRVLKPGGMFVLNVKDHVRAGKKQEVVAWQINTLCTEFGLDLVALDLVPTRGLMAGSNHDERVCAEVVATFTKPEVAR